MQGNYNVEILNLKTDANGQVTLNRQGTGVVLSLNNTIWNASSVKSKALDLSFGNKLTLSDILSLQDLERIPNQLTFRTVAGLYVNDVVTVIVATQFKGK